MPCAHLHHGDDGLLRVGQLRLSANTQQFLVMNHSRGSSELPALHEQDKDLRGDEAVDRVGLHCSIGIDHEHVLVESRVDTDDILDLVIHFQLEGVHG